MSSLDAIQHAQQVRRRLINPPNAVKDEPINLRKRKVEIALVPEPPKKILPPAPEPKIVVQEPVFHIADDSSPMPADLPGIIKEIRKLQKHLGRLSTECANIFVQMSHKGPKGHAIVDAVAEHYGCTGIDLVSDRRPAWIAEPRQLAVYLCRTMTTLSLVNIGRIFGGRDHTTILHSVRVVEERRKTDMHIDASITMLTEKLAVT